MSLLVMSPRLSVRSMVIISKVIISKVVISIVVVSFADQVGATEAP